MWTLVCEVCCRCRAFMLATVDLMTCLRVNAQTTLTSWPFHVCIPCPWQLFVLVTVSVSVDSSFCAVHGCFDQKSFQFPMEWGWRNGFKIRWDNWLEQLCVLCWSQFKGSQNPSMLETSGILGNLLYFCFCWVLHCVVALCILGVWACHGSTFRKGYQNESLVP